MRRALKWTFISLGVPFLLIQLVRPERANPSFDRAWSIEAKTKMPPDVVRILDQACMDCHSNETRWPWYSNIAPLSWMVASDVEDGRSQINFSEWARYNRDEANARLTYMASTVRGRSMPLPSYVRMHPEARLTEAEVDVLVRWIDSQIR